MDRTKDRKKGKFDARFLSSSEDSASEDSDGMQEEKRRQDRVKKNKSKRRNKNMLSKRAAPTPSKASVNNLK